MSSEIERLHDRLGRLDERLRLLEGGSRVGFGSMRSAWGTAAADPSVFGAYESGPAGSTWADDRGGTGTGYPSIVIPNGPTRYMILWSARPINIATNAVSNYRCAQVLITVSINGNDAPAEPNARRSFANMNTGTVDQTMTMLVTRSNTTPNITKTFQVRAQWLNSNPGGTIIPRLTDIYLGIIPVSVG